jgi:ribosome-binding protein aMBF1 (putative translation factor)
MYALEIRRGLEKRRRDTILIQIQITLSEDVMESIRNAAAKRGISPGIFTRMMLYEKFGQKDAESKSYSFSTRNWRELEAYVKIRNLGSVEGFAPIAMDMAMSRSKLSARQKADIAELIKDC